jgi:hypothetical protein
MTIQYANGNLIEAVLLYRAESNMRIALSGADDIVELTLLRGVWVTEDCEPVQVAFEWQRQPALPIPTEADCICPPEVAARLIHLLYTPENDELKPIAAPMVQAASAIDATLVI